VAVSVDVVVDPAAAQEGIGTIADGLSSLEDKGKRTGAALADSLAKGTGADNVTRSFAALADAIDEEAAALAKIRAPARDFDRELAAIDKLQRDGKISTSEWAAAVAQLNKQLAASPLEEYNRKAREAIKQQNAARASNTIGLPNAPSASGPTARGMIGGALDSKIDAGMLAAAGAAGLLGNALLSSVNHWAEMREAARQATNVLTKYYDTTEQANAALSEQRDLALSLHTSLGSAVGAYDAVRQATSALYLTSQQQIDVTRNLGRIMEMNGKPLSEAAGVMERLQYAIEVGSMSLLDFQSIAKNYPDILALWTKATDKSTKELRQMAQDGKLNTTVIRQFVDAIQKGDGVLQNYAKRTLTIDQAMQSTGKNAFDAAKYVLEFNRQIGEESKPAALSAEEAVMRVANSYKKLFDDVKKANEEVAKGQAIAALGFGAAALDRAGRDIKTAKDVIDTVKQAREDLTSLRQQINEGIVPRNAQSRSKLEGLQQAIDPEGFASYKRIVGDILEPQRLFSLDLATLNRLMDRGAINTKQYADELDKLRKQYNQFDPAAARQAASLSARFPRENFDEKTFWNQGQDPEAAKRGFMKLFGVAQDAPKAMTDQIMMLGDAFARADAEAQKLSETQEYIAGAMRDTVDSFADQLVDTAQEANESWASWGHSTLDMIERMIVKGALMQAVFGSPNGSAIDGKFGGVWGALFGGSHATGGEYTVPGHGGPDSRRVMFNLTPGERVLFVPPGAYRPQPGQGYAAPTTGGGGGMGAPTSVNVRAVYQGMSPRDLLQALDGPDGRTVLLGHFQQSRSEIRAILGIG